MQRPKAGSSAFPNEFTSGPRRRGIVIPIVFTLAAAAALVALGTWQLETQVLEGSVIAELAEKLSAPPVRAAGARALAAAHRPRETSSGA
jgi:cytochrome oxidase assembly protein ShyY1